MLSPARHEKISSVDLPSLNALRAFEAAARHLSLTLAGRELHVTQSAISHQVQNLEDELGVELFRRLPRSLRLTPAGEALAAAAREAFGRIEQAARAVHGRSARLCVSVLPSLAARWLLPRLKRFRASWPRLDLRIHASQEPCDFAADGVDVALRYGRGGWKGLRAEKLLRGEAVRAGVARALPLLPGLSAGARGAARGARLPGLPGRRGGPSGGQAEEGHQIERLLDGARAALTAPRARPPAIHAVDEVPAAHPLAALQGPGLLRVLVALLADLHAVGRLEPPLLQLLAHGNRMLDPRRQRRLLPHPAKLS